jgi:hypothetical protein
VLPHIRVRGDSCAIYFRHRGNWQLRRIARKIGVRGAAPTPAERVCQLTVELLTRTGYADDVTILAAQRLAEPVPVLRLELSNQPDSVTAARHRRMARPDRCGTR